MRSEMDKGLLSEPSESSLLMIPTHLTAVPSGEETGDFLALDLGGTNFRVLKVRKGRVAQVAWRGWRWGRGVGGLRPWFDTYIMHTYTSRPLHT